MLRERALIRKIDRRGRNVLGRERAFLRRGRRHRCRSWIATELPGLAFGSCGRRCVFEMRLFCSMFSTQS